MDMEVEPSVSISSSKKRKHYRTISSKEEFDDSTLSLPMNRLKVHSSFNASDLAGATLSAADPADTEFSELEVHIPVSQSVGAIPFKIDAHQPLDGNEALQLMRNAQTKHAACISTAPPVQPQGGTVFLYNLGLDKSKWDLMKRKIRYILGLCYCNIGYYNFIVVLNTYWHV